MDGVLSRQSVPNDWPACKKVMVGLIDMWKLMTYTVDEGDCLEALSRNGVSDMAGLYRLADARFAVTNTAQPEDIAPAEQSQDTAPAAMNTEPSGDIALDAMVVAAAFLRADGDGGSMLNWIDWAADVQQEFRDDRDEEEDEDEDFYNMGQLFCDMEREMFGFDAEALNKAFAELFGDKPSDAALVSALALVTGIEESC